MGERTRVVAMSRAQANCCRLLSTSLCKSTEVHGTGGRESVAFLRRWVLLSTARLQEVVTRSFSLARPSLAALFFVCSQARRGGSRGGARGEAATAPTAICSGVVGGRRYYEEGSHGAQVVFFFSIPARLCAFSDSGRWQLRVAAGYGHRARRQGHFGAWVCLLGSWGWFRPLSAVAGPAELAFLVKALFLNWAYY